MTSTIDRPTDTGRPVVRRLADLDHHAPPPAAAAAPGTAAAAPAAAGGGSTGGVAVPSAASGSAGAPAPTSGRRGGPPGRPDGHEVRGRAMVVLRLIIEVVHGRRPAAQLAGMVSAPVRRYVVAATGRLGEPDRRPAIPAQRSAARVTRVPLQTGYPGPTLRSIRVCYPGSGVAEVSAVWRYRGRSRALAARFELLTPAELLAKESHPDDVDDEGPAGGGQPGRWCCTALRLG